MWCLVDFGVLRSKGVKDHISTKGIAGGDVESIGEGIKSDVRLETSTVMSKEGVGAFVELEEGPTSLFGVKVV